jgi:DNA-binding NtrC family response regulator
MRQERVLIVDDDAGVRDTIRRYLETKRFSVSEADSCASARERLQSFRPDAVVLDVQLPDGDGIDLLQTVKQVAPAAPCVMITGYGSVPLAVRAVKAGASDFLAKPVSVSALLALLTELLPKGADGDGATPSKKMRAAPARTPFVGTSRAIRQLEEDMDRIGATESPLLILGETGTGKSVLARWVHARGPRAAQPFVEVNCAGLTRELAETELFGHERGAFTGAQAAKQGLLEAADRGTLFLDEVGDLDLQVQPKLLKALEEQRFRRMGEVKERSCDVRLIAATHLSLSGPGSANFRTDLYYRISTLRVTVPSLRERAEDIPALAREILDLLTERARRGSVVLSTDAERVLKEHAWPGNIRELRNILESALCLARGPVITAADLRLDTGVRVSAPASSPSLEPTNLALDDHERQLVEMALRNEGGSVYDAAQKLGISKSTLYERIKRYRLDLSGFRIRRPDLR